MLNQLFKTQFLVKVASASAVVFMLGATSVHAQSSGATATTTDPASTQSTTSSGQSGSSTDMPATGSSGASGTGTAATSGATGTSGSTDKSGTGNASGTTSAPGANGATATSGSTGSTNAAGGTTSTGATAATGGSTQAKINAADRKVMHALALSNLGEIAAAKIALEKSQNDDVKKFAQQMIDDHTKANDQLKQLADQKGVTLPTQPDKKHMAMSKKMEGMQGEAFDRHYMTHAGMQDHHKADRLVDRAGTRVKDPELKALIAQMSPTIDQHLQMARDMRQGTTSSGAGTSAGSASQSKSSASKADASSTGAAKSAAKDSSSGKQGASTPKDSASGAPTGK